MKKRLFAVALTALIPATGMLAYNEFWYRKERDAEIHTQVDQAARQVTSEMDRILEGTRSLLIATSSIPAVYQLDPARCGEVLATIASQVNSIRTIVVLDTQGKLVCDSIGTRIGADMSDRPYFRQALTSDGFVIGEYTQSRLSGQPVLPVARALRRGSALQGVLVTGIRLDWLQERIEERGVLPGGAVIISDRKGTVLARNPEPERFVGTPVIPSVMKLVHAEAPGTTESESRDGVMRIIGYQPVSEPNSPFFIASGISRAAAFEPINRGTLTAALLIVFGGIAAALAALFVGNRFVLKPITQVVSVLERWASGDLAARTGMHGRYGEIGQVGASVDKLLDELDRRRAETQEAEAARTFLSRELSHRVKNTLSVVQAIARQTFGKVTPPQALDTFALRVRALAGAYDALLADEWESADIHEVVSRATAPHHAPGDDRFRASGAEIMLPPQAVVALSLVLHELATNAAKYGALSNVEGHVEIDWARDGNRIKLHWNEFGGPPVTPPAREGFGTKVMSRAFPPDFEPDVTFDYRPEGLRFTAAFSPICPVKAKDGSNDSAT